MAASATPKRPGFALGIALGLIVGVFAGIVVDQVTPRLRPSFWVEAGGEWRRLPSQELAGALPQRFETPAKAWDYSAETRALPEPVTARPAIVRVDVGDVSGPVGVSLAKPDGSALISREAVAPVGAGPVSLYFRSPGGQPIGVLVRNAGKEGAAGAVTVRDIRYAPEAAIPPRQLGKINKAGVNCRQASLTSVHESGRATLESGESGRLRDQRLRRFRAGLMSPADGAQGDPACSLH